ncbi:hypothetical protein M5689_003545 [Euphorbia peplus]|nr:hypothetical protein M5689_003545 [Euphorbia peplus]
MISLASILAPPLWSRRLGLDVVEFNCHNFMPPLTKWHLVLLLKPSRVHQMIKSVSLRKCIIHWGLTLPVAEDDGNTHEQSDVEL